MGIFATTWSRGSQSLFLTDDSYLLGAVSLLVLNAVVLGVRELSRALAAKHSGREVPAAGLLVYAAITFDPSKARGLDGAMRTILDLPFGQILLTLVAVGIAAFGVYLFVRARYPERT